MFSHSLLIALFLLCCFSKHMLGNEPEVNVNTTFVSCFGGSDGTITVKIADISQEFTVQIFKYSPTGSYLEAKQKNDTTYFIASDLTAGKYLIEIKGSKGFTATNNIEVLQHDKLETGKISIEKKLSSPDASDAILKVNPIGGASPYTFCWNVEQENKNSQVLKNVPQGTYSCIINDANKCGPVKTTILFNQYVIPDIIEE